MMTQFTIDLWMDGYAEACKEFLSEALDSTATSVTIKEDGKFKLGDFVKKVSGSQWHGVVVGTYSTELTPEGYAVESWTEKGSVQIYPSKALDIWVWSADMKLEE
jgi:hypothetical protein